MNSYWRWFQPEGDLLLHQTRDLIPSKFTGRFRARCAQYFHFADWAAPTSRAECCKACLRLHAERGSEPITSR